MELDDDCRTEQQGDAVLRLVSWRMYLIHKRNKGAHILDNYLKEVLSAERKKANGNGR